MTRHEPPDQTPVSAQGSTTVSTADPSADPHRTSAPSGEGIGADEALDLRLRSALEPEASTVRRVLGNALEVARQEAVEPPAFAGKSWASGQQASWAILAASVILAVTVAFIAQWTGSGSPDAPGSGPGLVVGQSPSPDSDPRPASGHGDSDPDTPPPFSNPSSPPSNPNGERRESRLVIRNAGGLVTVTSGGGSHWISLPGA